MNDMRFDAYVARLRDMLPGVVVQVKPFFNGECPGVHSSVTLIGVPADELDDVSHRTLGMAWDAWPEGDLPFLITQVTPEHGAKHYADIYPADRHGRNGI
jgi:hypothetical protein